MHSYVKGALVLACIAVVGVGGFSICEGSKYKNSTLKSVDYSFGGDMLGSYKAARLETDGHGGARLVLRGKKHHAARVVTATYEVPGSALQKAKEMMLAYDMYGASKRPRSDLIALDAGSSTLSFSFVDKPGFDVGSELKFSDKQRNGYRAIHEYLYGLAKGKQPVSVQKEERRISLNITGYQLRFNIRDSVAKEDYDLLGGKHRVTPHGDNAKIFYPSRKFDVSGLSPAKSGAAGSLAYYEPRGEVMIFFNPFEPMPGLYELGELEMARSTALKLIAEMPEGEYDVYAFSD